MFETGAIGPPCSFDHGNATSGAVIETAGEAALQLQRAPDVALHQALFVIDQRTVAHVWACKHASLY